MKGHTYTATATAGISGNVLTGGPSVSGMIGAGATYTSTFSFKRDIPDMNIKPFMGLNEVKWNIVFQNLRTNTDKGGFCSDGAHRIKSLRWIWKVNRQEAIKNLYSGVTPGAKNIFYFKINLYARFARVIREKEKKKTDYLPVFDDNNGEISQIMGLIIPDAQHIYKLTKQENPLGGSKLSS
ncbi:MAG: hypothetical protein IBJ00_04295 [Alphaproteobacteria bacterium]|nr:hypothetical protein [Alphaproteobacteria bacterium]